MAVLSLHLEAFRTFANSTASANQAAALDRAGATVTAAITSTWLGRAIGITQNSKDAIAANNRVRDALVASLKEQFGVVDFTALPPSIQEALRGTHASTGAEDFAFDANGKSTSGKPLTKRRIAAVIAAVEQEIHAEEIPVRHEKVTPEVIAMRQEHQNEIVDGLMAKFTDPKAVEPLVTPRFAGMARSALTQFVQSRLVNMGDGMVYGRENNNFSGLADKLHLHSEGFGFLSRNWLSGSAQTDAYGRLVGGGNYRRQFLEQTLKEVLLAYNARHPESAYFDYEAQA